MSDPLIAPTYNEIVQFRKDFILLNGDIETLKFLLDPAVTGATLETRLGDATKLAKFNLLMSSPNGAAAVLASSTAMNAVAASSTAMNAVIASSTALASVFGDSTAKSTFKSSTALTAKSVPAMTSNTAPSGVASASTEFSGTYAAWKALDAVGSSTSWISASGGVANQWLKYDFSAAVFIHTVEITGDTVNPDSPVKNFRIEYSDDNSAWSTASTGLNTNDTVLRTYDVSVAGRHRYWRVFSIDNFGNANYTAIGELQLKGFA